jgi:Uma2 family endonuclease
MNAIQPIRMTVDEVLRWSPSQQRGRYELEVGRVIVQPPETIAHTDQKTLIYSAASAAISRSGQPVYAMPDGPTDRSPGERAHEPDALVAPLPKPARGRREINNPIVVFEVLAPAPASIRRDLTTKLRGYALAPTIEHDDVVAPEDRILFRYRRQGGQLVAAEELSDGILRLDPPGVEVPAADLLIPLERDDRATA